MRGAFLPVRGGHPGRVLSQELRPVGSQPEEVVTKLKKASQEVGKRVEQIGDGPQ